MNMRWGGALLFVGAMVLSGCSSSGSGFRENNSYEPIDPSNIISGYTYKLTGSAESVDLTMSTPGGTSQQSGASLPFEQEVDDIDFLYISAQITDELGGDVTCEIVASNGDVVATNTASGFPSIVTCDNT